MQLVVVLEIVQVIAILAYLVLAGGVLLSGQIVFLPLFFTYALVMVVDLVWHPLTIAQAIWIQPWLLSLRFCITIEALLLAARLLDRKNLVLFLLCFGIAGSIAMSGFHDPHLPGAWYRIVTQHIHLGLAAICIAGNLFQLWDRDSWSPIWTPHFRILSVYMVLRGAVSFFSVPQGVEYHHIVRIVWLTLTTLWVCVWLWYDREELRSSRFEALDSVL